MERLIRSMILLFAVLLIATSITAQGMGGGGGGMMGGSGGHSLTASAPGDGVGGPMYPQRSVIELRRQSQILESQINQQLLEMQAAKQKLDTLRKQHEAGQVPDSEVTQAQLEMERAEAQFQQTSVTYEYVRLLIGLATPVSIDVKDADIRQVAQVLTKAASVPKITVGEDVPKDAAVTTQAENVPLAGVLEVIANSVGLVIEPFGSGGVRLSKPAKLKTDGKVVTYEYMNWPWSDEWAFGGGGGTTSIGRRWLGLYSAGIGLGSAAQQTPKSVAAPSSLVLTGVGSNTLVVAEPGVGPQGEPGFWLTLYKLDNNRFIAGGKTFHRSLGTQPVPKASGGGGGGG